MSTRVTLVVLITLFFISCKKTPESLIKKDFQYYVNNNFNNPKDLVEIVSILPKDTVSLAELEHLLKKQMALSFRLDSIKVNTDSINLVYLNKVSDIKNRSKIRNMPSFERIELQQLAAENLANSNKMIEFIMDKGYNTMKANELLDSLKYESPKYGYEIKYREKINGEMQIKAISAYLDSLTNKTYIKPNGWSYTDSDASTQMAEMWKMLIIFSGITQSQLEDIKKTESISKKLETFVNGW